MSDRNTGLFVAGHVSLDVITTAFRTHCGDLLAELVGEEAPRVGHGTRRGHAYTLVALRLFEVAGLLLMDEDEPPGGDALEVHLGQALSSGGGQAIFLFFDEENAAGGAARFEDGTLVDRECWDGRDTQPMHRHRTGSRPVDDLDTSDWIWRPASDAIERMSTPMVGPGVRTDDEIEALIEGAPATPVALGAAPAPASRPTASAPDERVRRRDRLKGMFGKFRQR